MSENSSPLVEYYALLQCLKGSLILHYDIVNQVFFFTHHGLKIDGGYQEKPPYVTASVYTKGVFYGLVLHFCYEEIKHWPHIDDYLPSL